MSASATRDLADEIRRLFKYGETDKAIDFLDALIASGDISEIERLRSVQFKHRSGDTLVRTLLARRIDTAPLAGFGMSSIFAIQVYGRPSPLSPEAVKEHLQASWGPGLTSIAVEGAYRGFAGLPATPRDRMALARICATDGPAAALSALPKVRRRGRQRWDPQFIVCAATSDDFRDDFSRGPDLLTGRISEREKESWMAEAYAAWAGEDTFIHLPRLLGAAVEIARKETVLQEIHTVASRANGRLLDIAREPDGSLRIASARAVDHVVEGAGFLKDEDILNLTDWAGAYAGIRNPLAASVRH